jgi:inosine/xanthosine triphosphatase
MSDEETKNGAGERAIKALEIAKADIGVGLEGGVFVEDSRLWNTVWCCVVDKKEGEEYVNGLRFMLPERIAKEILKGGEMGPVMDSIIGSENIKQKQGAIGVITDGWISREEAYINLVKIALGRLLSKEW